MQRAMNETTRRRRIQQEYNAVNNITPQSISKRIDEILTSVYEHDYVDFSRVAEEKELYLNPADRQKKMALLEKQMKEAAQNLEFEKAALLRDRLRRLKKRDLEIVG
jgi:excinuclease ABC subunit B